MNSRSFRNCWAACVKEEQFCVVRRSPRDELSVHAASYRTGIRGLAHEPQLAVRATHRAEYPVFALWMEPGIRDTGIRNP